MSNSKNSGLWPFTEMVVAEIEKTGMTPLKIEEHDADDPEGIDFIWGELTPNLSLSAGEYLQIDREYELFDSSFGTRAIAGGDPHYDIDNDMRPTVENAKKIAEKYVKYFSRK